MPHLAGAACGVCRNELMGFRDGAFCPTCESPVHIDCARSATAETPETVCPRCGTQKRVAKQWREREAACENELEVENREANVPSSLGKLSKVFEIFDILVFTLFKRVFHSGDETPDHLKPAAPIEPVKKKPWEDRPTE
jgi:hypothetical protein